VYQYINELFGLSCAENTKIEPVLVSLNFWRQLLLQLLLLNDTAE